MVSALVVDIGTTSLRTALVSRDGSVQHVEQRPLTVRSPQPGEVELDANEIAALTLECATATILAGGPADVVGIANQRQTTVLFDANTRTALGPALGGALAPFLTAWMVVSLGHWRPVLWIDGAVGLVVADLYWHVVRNRPSEHPACNAAERALIGSPPVEPPLPVVDIDKAIFRALKPGGSFVVVDDAADKGAGFAKAQSLHRSEPDAVKAEITAAGFTFDGESKALASTTDNRAKPAMDGAPGAPATIGSNPAAWRQAAMKPTKVSARMSGPGVVSPRASPSIICPGVSQWNCSTLACTT